jgi:2'-5' RNA ligase
VEHRFGGAAEVAMRLFVALDSDPEIRQRVTHFRDEMRKLAPGVRWVGPETFHVTLQFLGETPKVEEIKAALATVKAVPVTITFRGAGFFPTPQRARVFWVGIESGKELQSLADSVGAALAPLGFKRDAGLYNPHLTLARAGSGRPHFKPGDKAAPGLQQVRVKLEGQPPPEFGTMTAHEFVLYQSTLSPSGSRYTKLASFPLR